MSIITSAWLLQASEELQFSIGEINAAEYIVSPTLRRAPLLNSFSHVIFWRDKVVPIVDLNLLVTNKPSTNFQHVFVITYQEKENMELKHAAFLLSSSPEKIFVDDNYVRDLPENYPERLKASVVSFFEYKNQSVSIFSLANLCADRA